MENASLFAFGITMVSFMMFGAMAAAFFSKRTKNPRNRIEQYRAALEGIGVILSPQTDERQIMGRYRGRLLQVLLHDTEGNARLTIYLNVRHAEGFRLWISPDGILFNSVTTSTVAHGSKTRKSRVWTGDQDFDETLLIASTPKSLIENVLSGDENRDIRSDLMRAERIAIDMENGTLRCYPNPRNLHHVLPEEWDLWFSTVFNLAHRIEQQVVIRQLN